MNEHTGHNVAVDCVEVHRYHVTHVDGEGVVVYDARPKGEWLGDERTDVWCETCERDITDEIKGVKIL